MTASTSDLVATLAGPALGLLELDSIARGYVVADAVLKRAPVTICLAEPASPGKYLLLFSGGVAEVEESFQAGVEAAGSALLDRLLLTQVDEGLVEALKGTPARAPKVGESVAVVETQTVAATLLAADTALKRAEVTLARLQLARGVGGKGWFLLTGALHMVEAALEGVHGAVQAPLLLATELIQSPHPELRGPVI